MKARQISCSRSVSHLISPTTWIVDVVELSILSALGSGLTTYPTKEALDEQWHGARDSRLCHGNLGLRPGPHVCGLRGPPHGGDQGPRAVRGRRGPHRDRGEP